MLQAPAADRFKLAVHYECRSALFALCGEGWADAEGFAVLPAIDESAEFEAGRAEDDLPDGPARTSRALDAPKTYRSDKGWIWERGRLPAGN